MKNKIVICLYVLLAIIIAYALACIVNMCIHFSFGQIFYIFITLIVCATFSAILYISIKMNWGKVLKKYGRDEEAKMYDKAMEEMKKAEEEKALSLSDKIANEKHSSSESKSDEKPHFILKNFLIGLLILIVFGGAGSGMTYFASTQYARITGADFVKTTATIASVEPKQGDELAGLVYLFYDEEGNEVYAKFNSGFEGLVEAEGNSVTIYYNRQNPQQVETLSTPIMCYLVGGFFIVMSVFAFLSLCGFNASGKNKLAPIFIGGIFAGLAATVFAALYLAVGGSFVQILLCGGGMYAVGCFGIIGLYFLLFGIGGLITSIFKFIFGGRK